MTITVPFEFHVNNKKFEAGKYEIRQLKADMFLLRKADGDDSILISASTGAGSEKQVESEKVIFQRYGNQYFLREIYHQPQTSGRMLSESKAERRARKEAEESEDNLAQTNAKPEKVEIVATVK
jgi:hypothetical protein